MNWESDREPLPESHPLSQLTQLVRHAGEELAIFRRRALAAEAKLREYEASLRPVDVMTEQRAVQLEAENAALRSRLEYVTAEARAILAQVKFLRQQVERPVVGRGKREAGREKLEAATGDET